MEATKPAKKVKTMRIEEKQIKPTENMNALQTSLSKCTVAGNVVRLPFEKLDNYPELRKALLNAGATYKSNTFVFSGDAQPFIDRLMGGQSVNIKKEYQFFPTPPNVAHMIINKINWSDGLKVGEFSAGQGGLLDFLPKEYNLSITAVELMSENVSVLKSKGYNAICGDFLLKHYGNVDVVILNPPFAKNQDIDHFMHAWNHLNDGGQIACITSPHWTFASDKKSKVFRDFLNEIGAEWEEINPGEFKSSGTNIKTFLISCTRS